MRIFPPHQHDALLAEVLGEITERPNPTRRLRGYPRVVKRRQVGAKLTKRADHREAKYLNPPKIHLLHPAA
jgi:hypothetical protein